MTIIRIPGHGHVITLHHAGVRARADCQCGSWFRGRLHHVEAWIAEHRRRHFPRFAA